MKTKICPMERHDKIMKELQVEWELSQIHHTNQRDKNKRGIRSSQISALVMFLIKKGVID